MDAILVIIIAVGCFAVGFIGRGFYDRIKDVGNK